MITSDDREWALPIYGRKKKKVINGEIRICVSMIHEVSITTGRLISTIHAYSMMKLAQHYNNVYQLHLVKLIHCICRSAKICIAVCEILLSKVNPQCSMCIKQGMKLDNSCALKMVEACWC